MTEMLAAAGKIVWLGRAESMIVPCLSRLKALLQIYFRLPEDILSEIQTLLYNPSHVRSFDPSAVEPEPLVGMFLDH